MTRKPTRRHATSLAAHFDAPGNGSMLMTLRSGEVELPIWASYIPCDSVRDLAGAISLLLKGGREAVVSWNEEPTEYEFRFHATGTDVVLRVRRYLDSRRTAKGGEEVFDLRGSREEICIPFFRALRALQTLMPPNEFKAAWGHHFPDQKVVEIGAILSGREESRA